MNDHTKHNNIFNSNEKSPIQHEIPRIREFYNKHRENLYECTPLNKKTILKLLQTPALENVCLEKRYASIRNSDLFSSMINSGLKYSSPGNLRSQLSKTFESTIKKNQKGNFFDMIELYNN